MPINDESLLGSTVRIDTSQARASLESRISELHAAADATGTFPSFDEAAIEQQVLKDYVKAGRMGDLRTPKGAEAFSSDLEAAMMQQRAAYQQAQQAWQRANVRDLSVIDSGMPFYGVGGSGGGGIPPNSGSSTASGWDSRGGGGPQMADMVLSGTEEVGYPHSYSYSVGGMPDIDVTGYSVWDITNDGNVGPKPPNWWQRNASKFTNSQFGMAAAYAGMHALSAAGSAYASANNGEYRTREEIDESGLGVLPGLGGMGGAIAGALVGNPVVGALVGGGIGSGIQQIGGAGLEREQAARQASEYLAASLGEASSKAKEFTEAIQASGVATKEFQAGLQMASGVGSFGPNTQAGLGRLVNAFGDTAGADLGAISGIIRSNPMLAAYGQRLASGNISTGDIQSLEIQAADDADFGTLHTLQQGAQKSQLKDNATYQDAQAEMRSGYQPWRLGGIPGAIFRYYTGNRISQEMEHNLPADSMAPVSNDIANTMAVLNTEILGSGTELTGARGAFAIAGMNGSTLGGIQQAGQSYLEKIGAAEVPLEAKADILRGQVASATNDTDREAAAKRLADVEAALSPIYIQSASTKRDLFNAGVDTQLGEYGYTLSQDQLALTRSLLTGGTYASNAGRQRQIQATQHERAQYEIETADDPDSPMTPQERLQRKSAAAAELAESAVQASQFRFAGIEQGVTGLGLNVQSAMIGVQRAGYSEGPEGVYEAAQKAVKALTAEFEFLTEKIRSTSNVDQRYQLQGQANAVQAQLLGLEHTSELDRLTSKADYAIGGAGLSDTYAETARLLHGTGGESMRMTSQVIADSTAAKISLDAIADDMSFDPITRQKAQAKSAQIDLANIQRRESVADNWAPPPELVDRLINDKGSLYRMGRTFGLPGDMNAGQLSYFQDLRSELSQLTADEGDPSKLTPDVRARWDARRNGLQNEIVDAGSNIVNRFAYQLPTVAIGSASFEERFMPSDADYAAEFENSAAHATNPAIRQQLQLVGARNFGYKRQSTYDAYMNVFGGMTTAGSDPARSQPGNQSAQALSGNVNVTIKLDTTALNRGGVERTFSVPITSQTSGMGRIMPGAD